MIYLKVCAGLCNRLRAINAGIRLARETEQKLRILWERTSDMNASYESLFDRSPLFAINDTVFSRFSLSRVIFSKCNPFFFSHNQREAFILNARQMNHGLVCYEDFYDFYPNTDYRWLRPNEAIRNQIAELEYLAKGRLGIHIRRTDNLKCIQNSPTNLFVDKMHAEIDRDSTVKFFLSTDDPCTREELARLFPDRVSCRFDVAPRQSVNGVHDALIDLWLLSMTNKIYGSYPSSFSAVAAQIGGINLEYLTVENPWGEGARKEVL